MASWIGCIGPEASCAFSDIAVVSRVSGVNFALAVLRDIGETAILTTSKDGCAQVEIGNSAEAGCSATITPDGPTVTLACDPFGLYGVFTARVGETLWFASNIERLRHLARVPAAIHPDALHGYLCLSFVPTPITIYAGIDALPAGSRLTIAPLQSQQSPPLTEHLWKETLPFRTDEEAAVRTLRKKLQVAVARQLEAAREVGVFLSGGVDSSLVAALLAEAGARLHLYTLDFGPPYNAELPHAHTVAAHLKRPLHIVSARDRDIAKTLRATAAAMQQPFGDAVTVPLYLLGQTAAQQVETVFNGEFGDQLFGGWANKPMIAAELYDPSDRRREAAYLATFHRFYGLTKALYTPALQQTTAGADVAAWIRPALATGSFSSLLHRLRAANFRLKGAQNISPRARQLAEACGLRVRSPFCDRELAGWTFACPPEWFLQGACEKYLLKRAAEPYLPGEIIWREKRGMGVPATQWCTGGMRREIGRILQPRRLRRDGWFRPEAVRALCQGSDHPGEFRTRRLGEKLWLLLMFHVWQDMHTP